MPVELTLPCGVCAPVNAMTVDEERGEIRCVSCGHARALTSRPLYLISGPPAVGKTALVERLAGRLPGLPVFDTDLWGNVAHPDWDSWATAWLLVAHANATCGLSTVLCGYGMHRWKIEGLPARRLIGTISVLNLDLADDELRRRLDRRSGYDDERIERKVAMAARLRAEADANIDTIALSPDAVAAEAELWLRRAARI